MFHRVSRCEGGGARGDSRSSERGGGRGGGGGLRTRSAVDARRRRVDLFAVAPSRRGAAGPAPFDSAAFAAVAAKRKLEIINKQCLVSLKQLMQHKWAFPFCAPVDHAALNLPTYPEIVKQPMDLGTVRQGIERGGVYSSCEEVNRDVALTFANAKLFNPPATDVHVMATTLEEFWAPRWEAIKERVREVDEGMAVEKESAEKKSAEMVARQTLAAEEMRCAGLMADLDLLRRQLGDLKRAPFESSRLWRPAARQTQTRHDGRSRAGFRGIARDIIAETEGGHKYPWTVSRDGGRCSKTSISSDRWRTDGWRDSRRCEGETDAP